MEERQGGETNKKTHQTLILCQSPGEKTSVAGLESLSMSRSVQLQGDLPMVQRKSISLQKCVKVSTPCLLSPRPQPASLIWAEHNIVQQERLPVCISDPTAHNLALHAGSGASSTSGTVRQGDASAQQNSGRSAALFQAARDCLGVCQEQYSTSSVSVCVSVVQVSLHAYVFLQQIGQSIVHFICKLIFVQ